MAREQCFPGYNIQIEDIVLMCDDDETFYILILIV